MCARACVSLAYPRDTPLSTSRRHRSPSLVKGSGYNQHSHRLTRAQPLASRLTTVSSFPTGGAVVAFKVCSPGVVMWRRDSRRITENIYLHLFLGWPGAAMECRVLSIQSHVVRGYVGNKSASFPLQVNTICMHPFSDNERPDARYRTRPCLTCFTALCQQNPTAALLSAPNRNV